MDVQDIGLDGTGRRLQSKCKLAQLRYTNLESDTMPQLNPRNRLAAIKFLLLPQNLVFDWPCTVKLSHDKQPSAALDE